ncbi:MAG: sulfotransferase [Candidatus Palauibacterales bacterium]|nr:sulfotransferase [Candidatus Palauibacterales bacterium]
MRDFTLADRVVWKLRRSIGGAGRRLLNAGATYRPIFVTGAVGSGTTFLALKLARTYECAGLVLESAHHVGPRSVLRVKSLGRVGSPRQYLEAVRPRPSWSADEIRRDLTALYRSVAFHSGSRVVDKGPVATMMRASVLHDAFPRADFVLVYRDPVVNLEGFRRKWDLFRNADLGSLIDFYAEIHDAFLGFRNAHPERTTVVGYEDLVTGGEARWDELARRLGLVETRRELRLRAPRHLVEDDRSNRAIMETARQRAAEHISSDERRRIEWELAGLHRRLESASMRAAASS